MTIVFFFSSRRRHTSYIGDWSSDVCSSDLVVLRMMPFDVLFAPEPDEMLRNVRPAAPMVVLATLRAVPAVVESVLTIVELFCVAVTVPPPVAVKESFAPVEIGRASCRERG